MVHESRADALEQLQASQARAREQEREQMHELMHELRSWKRQNERRMAELTMRTSATLTPLGETRVPARFGQLGGGACGGAAGTTTPSAVGGACADASCEDASCEGGSEEPKEGGRVQSRERRAERLLAASPRAALDVAGRLGSGNGARLTPLASRLANSPNWRGFGGGGGGGGGGVGCGGGGGDMSTIASEYATRKRQLGYGREPSELTKPSVPVARAPPPATTFAGARQPARARAGRDTPERGAAHGGAAHDGAAHDGSGEGNGRSLRELQRELESLKSSLSVYLGSGLA
jgi:hypothetical protein